MSGLKIDTNFIPETIEPYTKAAIAEFPEVRCMVIDVKLIMKMVFGSQLCALYEEFSDVYRVWNGLTSEAVVVAAEK